MNLYLDILKKYWGYDKFRDLQEEIIDSIYNGHDTLALMPTGGGKSITFQVPALAKKGMCIVVTPLIALMKDQVSNLREKNIRAIAVYSGMTHSEIVSAYDNCIFGDIKFLYISPERLSSRMFIERVKTFEINMIAVDEAHCISQWGYDFRPSYLRIAEIRTLLPKIPVLALTATATPEVSQDIQNKLKFGENSNFFKKSFERKNLAYVVRYAEDKTKMLLHIAKSIQGSGIIYVRSRKATKEIAEILRSNKISADYYNAGLKDEVKYKKQQAWKKEEFRIMVATNAFGMGIDKSNVRFVIHIDVPNSIEAYFQEAGRAGRDGKKAYAILLHNRTDNRKLKKQLSDSFPPKETIANIYNSISNYFQIGIGSGINSILPFDIFDFCSSFHYSVNITYHSLKILEQAGYLQLTSEIDTPSKVKINTKRDNLYDIPLDKQSDKILQIILRNYTGVFSDFVKINESLIRKSTGYSRQEIYKNLTYLSKYGIIKYIPQKNSAYIIYSLNREEKERIYIGKNIYEDLLEKSRKRINAIIDYIETDDVCRSRQLLLYFGEKNDTNCKQCDVCLHKNEIGINQSEFIEIKEEILNTIKKGITNIDEIVSNSSFSSYKTIKVYRFLCDNDIIS